MGEILQLKAKYYFGKDTVDNLAEELIQHHVKTAMLVYGGGSIKTIGLYDTILQQAKKAKVKLIEHGGVQPNPRDLDIYAASVKAREHKVDLIIAAGGGSVIDAAKVIGILATNSKYKCAWDYVLDQSKVTKPSLRIFSIITLAATGSENNDGSVITNEKLKIKRGVNTPSANPLVVFADPNYTLGVSKWQTACGIFDIFSHLLEQYYTDNKSFYWTQEYLIACMKTLLYNAKIVMKDLKNYHARENLLWTSTFALNPLSCFNNSIGDWKAHKIEHAVSALWDVEHGAGLAVITPTYINYMCHTEELFHLQSLTLAKELFHVKTIKKYIKELNKFIDLLKLPRKFTDFKVIKTVSQDDLNFLINHINCVLINKSEIVTSVINSIPRD